MKQFSFLYLGKLGFSWYPQLFKLSIVVLFLFGWTNNLLLAQKLETLNQKFHSTNDFSKQKTLLPNQNPNFQPKPTSTVENFNISSFEQMKKEGRREDLSKRDEFSRHFQNPDGTFTAMISSGPINYLSNGTWQEINTEIINSSQANFPFANTSNTLESYFGKNANSGVKTKTNKGEVKEFLNTKMYWEVNGQVQSVVQNSNPQANKKGSKLYYHQLYPNIDAEFGIEYGKRKLNYIIPSKSDLGNVPDGADYLVFYEVIELPQNWTYKINSKNDVEILTASGDLALIYAKPSVIENYSQNEESMKFPEENPASFSISQNGNQLVFLIKVKTSWLLNTDTLYPVAVDPTVYPNNAQYWTGWANGNGTGGDDNIRTGYNTVLFFSFLNIGFSKFNLSSIPDNSVIASVQSVLTSYARQGTLTGRDFAAVDLPIDVASASYAQIFNSAAYYISNTFTWPNNNFGLCPNNFTEPGVSYVQDALVQDYVSIGYAPYTPGNWGANNYAWFRGYSNNLSRPQLIITYADGTYTCNPQSTDGTYFIRNVQFVGSLIADTANPNTGYSANGYGNYTGLTNQAQQIPGGVINLKVRTDGINAFMKAWVDWNQDGLFDNTEKVYDTREILTPSSTFGFVVPAATPVGFYNIRIRTNRELPYFGPCKTLGNGETEDYRFEVIADCAAKITAININSTDGYRCGTGSVTLTATATAGTTEFRWYTQAFGGTYATTPTGTYPTPDISATTTYYVTAWNGSCESVFRTPIVARVDPVPTISFTTNNPDICGDGASISVTSAGDKEEVSLINEKFNSGLGVFVNQVGRYNDANANWPNRTSPYKPSRPPYYVVSPAIASGYNGGNYAAAITDVAQTGNITNRLALNSNLDASNLTNLKLDFDLYYEPTIIGDATYCYFRVQASANGGFNWTNIQTYTAPQGNPGVWSKQSLNIPIAFQTAQLRIRFIIFSYGAIGPAWTGDIATVDNVRLYGLQDLSPNMTWSGIDPGSIFESDCTTPYSGTTNQVCIIPNPTEIENDASWNITATASLSNGCSATGIINIVNNNKVWNPASGTDWASTTLWKPSTPVPTANNCVIVKKQVFLNSGTAGLAKNLTITTSGKLSINNNASLSVTDFIHNNATVDDFVMESGGSLLQVNDVPTSANMGQLTAKRIFTFSAERKQYNFIISPVIGQAIRPIYSNPPFVIYHDEATNWFYNAYNGDYVAGQGFAIKEPSTTDVPTSTVNAIMKGAPYNGTLSFPLSYTASPPAGVTPGFNLTGNPYPSNLDVRLLYQNNNTKIGSTFSFWDNRGNIIYQQQGSAYAGTNYARYNAFSDIGTAAPGPVGGARIPTRYVRPATAFMVQAQSTANGLTLDFNNSYRVAANGSPEFFGKGTTSASSNSDRYWINLITPSNLGIMTAITYFDNGNDDFDWDDSKAFGGADDFYSLANQQQLSIQGKSAFDVLDKVELGVRLFEAGIYTFNIHQTEGIFANDQIIYLYDKKLDIIHNLSDSDYSFSSAEGEYNNRFEIIYVPMSFEQDDSVLYAKGITIEKIDHKIVVQSTNQKIKTIKIFGLNGRIEFEKSAINEFQFSIPAQDFNNQIIIVQVEVENGEILSKKLVN